MNTVIRLSDPCVHFTRNHMGYLELDQMKKIILDVVEWRNSSQAYSLILLVHCQIGRNWLLVRAHEDLSLLGSVIEDMRVREILWQCAVHKTITMDVRLLIQQEDSHHTVYILPEKKQIFRNNLQILLYKYLTAVKHYAFWFFSSQMCVVYTYTNLLTVLNKGTWELVSYHMCFLELVPGCWRK